MPSYFKFGDVISKINGRDVTANTEKNQTQSIVKMLNEAENLVQVEVFRRLTNYLKLIYSKYAPSSLFKNSYNLPIFHLKPLAVE